MILFKNKIIKRLQRFVPTYGNWGGPGWSAGEWEPSDTNWDHPCIDSMDLAFKSHDYLYQMAINKYGFENSQEYFLDADLILLNDLYKIKNWPPGWSKPAPKFLWAFIYYHICFVVFVPRVIFCHIFCRKKT